MIAINCFVIIADFCKRFDKELTKKMLGMQGLSQDQHLEIESA